MEVSVVALPWAGSDSGMVAGCMYVSESVLFIRLLGLVVVVVVVVVVAVVLVGL